MFVYDTLAEVVGNNANDLDFCCSATKLRRGNS